MIMVTNDFEACD